jgi:hypothetical protein
MVVAAIRLVHSELRWQGISARTLALAPKAPIEPYGENDAVNDGHGDLCTSAESWVEPMDELRYQGTGKSDESEEQTPLNGVLENPPHESSHSTRLNEKLKSPLSTKDRFRRRQPPRSCQVVWWDSGVSSATNGEATTDREALAKGLEKQIGSGHAMLAEHRGLLTALGVALVAIGLGGLVSLSVGKTLADRHLGGVELVCLGIVVAGLAMLGAVLWSLRNLREFNRQLGIFVAEGAILLGDSWAIKEDDEE